MRAPIVSEPGSLIQLIGDAILGETTSMSGIEIRGTVDIGQHYLQLRDANEAEFFGEILLGDLAEGMGGHLLVYNTGAIFHAESIVIGMGIIQAPIELTRPLINDGLIRGLGDEQAITLLGTVLGDGEIQNVQFG